MPTVASNPDINMVNTKKHSNKRQQQQQQQQSGPTASTTSTSVPNAQPTSSLSISRNKHWKYISSYHGPWLQLPLELLESLYVINNDTVHSSRGNNQNHHGTGHSYSASPFNPATPPPPPPIDPVIFNNLITIRRLVDEAADLSVRAASTSSPLNTNGRGSGTMSAVRQHRMRELAVNKLALAYRIDEIATAVVTMQSASAVDEVASKVLKKNSSNMEAQYVNFFHEKIPSRMLSQSTSTEVLDSILARSPTTPEFYRTRGVVKCFKEDFPGALRDFKTALQYVKHRKRIQSVWRASSEKENDKSKGSSNGVNHIHNRVPNDEDECTGTESQLYFLRAACWLQYAVSIIDKGLQKVEGGPPKTSSANDGGMDPQTAAQYTSPKPYLTAEQYQQALTPLIAQVCNYAKRSIRDYMHFLSFYPTSVPPMAPPPLNVSANSSRHASPTSSRSSSPSSGGIPERVVNVGSFFRDREDNEVASNYKSGPLVPGSSETNGAGVQAQGNNGSPNISHHYATYHPLLVEAWYAIALNYLLLGDYTACAQWHHRIMQMHECIEGYPVFLPARSMAQADYVEVLERLKKKLLAEASERANSITNSGGAVSVYDDGSPHDDEERMDEDDIEDFNLSEKDAITKLLGQLMMNESGSSYATSTVGSNGSINNGLGWGNLSAGATGQVCTNPNHHHHHHHHLHRRPNSPTSGQSHLTKISGNSSPVLSQVAKTSPQTSQQPKDTLTASNGEANGELVPTVKIKTKNSLPINSSAGIISKPTHEQTSLPRQYPLFTQRADSIMVWVWSIVVPGLRFGDDESAEEEEEDGLDEKITGANGTEKKKGKGRRTKGIGSQRKE